jgi:hypothetical protein
VLRELSAKFLALDLDYNYPYWSICNTFDQLSSLVGAE